jgi:RAB protein geranylgeranyltransferase component A
MALNVKEALDKFLDLIEGIKEEEMRDLLSPKMTKAMLRVIRGLISGEERSSIIRGVSDECDWSERHAARIVDRILRRLEEVGVLTKEKKKPGKQRGRPPATCKLKQYDVVFSPPRLPLQRREA